MARFDMSGLDPIIDDMRKYGEKSGEAAQAMIMAGAEQVKLAWKRSAEEHKHRDSGDMIESIGYPRQPKDIGNALTIDIYPQGKDHKGVRNAEKAFITHYGTSSRPGDHWVDDADAYSEETAVPAMAKIWEDFIATGRVKQN